MYVADRNALPREVGPPPSPRKYWTRREVAEWLSARLSEDVLTLVGIDHGFSFPLQYFQTHGLLLNWPAFLEDFLRHWPTADDHVYVDFVRHGLCGNAAARSGDPSWRRLTEVRARTAKSVFRFDVNGSVAKSTHAGLPWLLFLRRWVKRPLHFWPFDGWSIPGGHSAVVEVYPSLWSRSFPREDRNPHQHDAYSIAAWMRQADGEGSLTRYLNPALEPSERQIAEIEGWILGVV